MSKVTVISGNGRQCYSLQQKIQILHEFEESGLGATAFAKKAGIPLVTLNMWRKMRKLGKFKPETQQMTSEEKSLIPMTQGMAVAENSIIEDLAKKNQELVSHVQKLTDEIYGLYAVIGKQYVSNQGVSQITPN